MAWTVMSRELVGGEHLPPQAPALSVVDRTAAPNAFVRVALAFAAPLDAARLRRAVGAVVAAMPSLGCRATKTQDGDWRLAVPPEAPSGGALLLIGRAPAPPPSLFGAPPRRAAYVDLGPSIFPGLPPSLPPEAAAAVELPLFAVALFTCGGGGGGAGDNGDGGGAAGCVLGVSISHMVADFGTLAAALSLLASAYSGARPPSPPPRPAAPAVAALAAAGAPPPPGFEPFNYLRPPPGWHEAAERVFGRPAPLGTVYHVPPARLAELKARALSDLAAAAPAGTTAAAAERAARPSAAAAAAGSAGSGGGEAPGEGEGEGEGWISTHDALIAHVWRRIASLPARRGSGPVPLTMGLDMRRRMPAAACGVSEAGQAALYGNLATTALAAALDVARGGEGGGAMALGAVARQLRRALPRSAALFPGDVAYAASRPSPPGLVILPFLRIVADADAGRTPLLMTSTWALDHAALSFGGAPPLRAGLCLSPAFPLVVALPAPAGAGGGFLVHVWLWQPEAAQLRETVPEL